MHLREDDPVAIYRELVLIKVEQPIIVLHEDIAKKEEGCPFPAINSYLTPSLILSVF